MVQNKSRVNTNRKKRLKWPIWIGILILLVSITFGIAKLTNFIQDRREQEAAVTVKVNSEQIEANIFLQTESKEGELFTSFVTFPYTKIESIDVTIYDWVQEQEDKFHKELEQIEDIIGETFAAHFSLDTEVTKVNETFYQL